MDLFTLKTVLRLTGLKPDTVRAWERRYSAVSPTRATSGRRMYSEREVNRLKLLAELTSNGHLISSIAPLSDQKLVSLVSANKTPVRSKSQAINPQIQGIAQALIQAIEDFDLPKLELQLARANYNMSPRDLVFYLIPQLMIQVGAKVESGKMTVAQEHALSELIKKNIRRIYDQLSPANGTLKPNKTLIFATPENHLHEFGVLMAAVLCRYQGFNTHYLGSNLPESSLSSAAKKLKAHAVVLGFSPATSKEGQKSTIRFLNGLNENLGPSTMLWMGGPVPASNYREFKRNVWIFESLEGLEKKIQNNYSSSG